MTRRERRVQKPPKPRPEISEQRALFDGCFSPETGAAERATPESASAATKARERTVRFRASSPEQIWVGGQRLEDLLIAAGQTKVIELRAFLWRQDWSSFEARYKPGGRRPFHPAVLVGLVILGTLEGVGQLRPLERLALTDLRAWWITGGEMPDHSTIGKFLNENADLMDPLFLEIAAAVLDSTGSSCKTVAGDGTVIQAAGSRYRSMKKEAALLAAGAARARANANPGESSCEEAAQRAERIAEVARERSEARTAQGKGKEADRVRVCTAEPEAPIQKQKNGGFAPSYRASAIANEDRVILSVALHPTSEQAVIPGLLDQANATARAGTGSAVEELLVDANYFCGSVLSACVERDVNVLCPEGKAFGTDVQKKATKLLPKADFDYDHATDEYVCPQGHRLRRVGQGAERKRVPGATADDVERRYVKYGGAPCAECPLRERCTTAKGRILKRYAGDDLKDGARLILGFPSARAVYQRRKGMIEPVFADFAERQLFRRFRRKGLAKARFELTLHAIAHNVGRYLALARAGRVNPSLLASACLGLLWRFWGPTSGWNGVQRTGRPGPSGPRAAGASGLRLAA